MTTVGSIAGQAGAATWIADKQSADRQSANRRAALHLEFTERSQSTYLVSIKRRRCVWSIKVIRLSVTVSVLTDMPREPHRFGAECRPRH